MQNVKVVLLGLGSYLTGPNSQSTINLVRELTDAGVDTIFIDDFEKLRTVQGDSFLKQAGNYLFVEVVDSQSESAIATAHVRPARYFNMRTALDIIQQDFGAYRRYDASFNSAVDMVRDITALRDAYVLNLSVVGASYETVMNSASAEFIVQHNLNAQVKITLVDFFNGSPVYDYTVTSATPSYVVLQFTAPRILRIRVEAVADWKI